MGRRVKIEAGQLWITEGRKNAKAAFVKHVFSHGDTVEYGIVNGSIYNEQSHAEFLNRFPTRIKGIKEGK